MAGPDAGTKTSPQFMLDPQGKPMGVQLDPSAYVSLLVQANVTDPTLWPPGMEKGAEALTRLREIEATCIAQYGEFDWEKLDHDEQDEYDSLCRFLDELRQADASILWEDYKDQRKQTSA